MRHCTIVPKGWPCELAECPPGIFSYQETFGLKTDYFDFFLLDGGSVFWGGLADNIDITTLIVQPCIMEWVDDSEW